MSDENNFEDDFDDLNADLDDGLMDDLDSAEGDDWEDDFEDWDDNADSLDPAAQGAPAKKKKKGGFGKLLFILIVLGGAGGAVYFTVLGGKMPGGNGQGTQPQNMAATGQNAQQEAALANMSAPDMPDVSSSDGYGRNAANANSNGDG